MINLIKRCIKEKIISVFTCTFLDKIVRYCAAIILARILSKNDYGIYNYAFNITALFMLLSSGINSAVLQFCSESKEINIQSAYFSLGMKYGTAINFVSIILMVAIAWKDFLPIAEANRILLIFIFVPLMSFGYSNYIFLLRANVLNNLYSITILSSSVIFCVLSIIGAYFFGLYGVVWMQNFAYLLTLILIFFIAKKYFVINTISILTKYDKRKFVNYSWAAFFAQSIGQLLYLIDIFLIGWILKQAYFVALYKVAMIIPFGLMFLPTTLVIFIYPYFARHRDEKNWIIKNSIIVLIFMLILNTILVVPMLIFTHKVILIFFGNKYANNALLVNVFRLLLIGYLFVGTLRAPILNILAMLRKINFNLITSVISSIIKLILAYILINKYGIVGAAYSTLFVFFFSSLLSMLFFFKALVVK